MNPEDIITHQFKLEQRPRVTSQYSTSTVNPENDPEGSFHEYLKISNIKWVPDSKNTKENTKELLSTYNEPGAVLGTDV